MSKATVQEKLDWQQATRLPDSLGSGGVYTCFDENGVELAQARASWLRDDEVITLESNVFELVRSADPSDPTDESGTFPIAVYSAQAQAQRQGELAIVRARMDKARQASLSDMERLAEQLARSCQHESNVWERRQLALMQERTAHQASLKALMCIKPELLSEDERVQVKALLKALLA